MAAIELTCTTQSYASLQYQAVVLVFQAVPIKDTIVSLHLKQASNILYPLLACNTLPGQVVSDLCIDGNSLHYCLGKLICVVCFRGNGQSVVAENLIGENLAYLLLVFSIFHGVASPSISVRIADLKDSLKGV